MRKGIPIVLLSVFCVTFFISCKSNMTYSNSSEYVFETDSQYYFQDFVGSKGYTMAESEIGYYYISRDKYLHYIERETMQDVVLCGRPDCLHDQRTTNIVNELKQCNAYVDCGLNYHLFYFNQRLYCFDMMFDEVKGEWVRVFLQMELDGTKRKVLWECEWPDYQDQEQYDTILHRGKLYFFTRKGTGTEEDSVTVLYAYDLSSEKLKEIYRYDQGVNRAANGLQAIGNSLYWARYLDDDFNVMELIRYDISTGETTIYSQGNSVFCGGNNIYLYFREYDMETQIGVTWLKKIDRAGNNLIALDYHKEEDWKMIRANEKYLFLCPQERNDTPIHVYDSETMEQIASIPLPENSPSEFSMFTFTATEEILLWCDFPHTVTYYANVSDIGTDNFQWHQVEKVN